jgi:hypothetical protein
VHRGRSFRHLVEEILGQGNEWENVREFLEEELGVTVEEMPQIHNHEEWEDIFGKWLDEKRRNPNLSDERFELLVRNDVNAYCAILQQRRALQSSAKTYGQRIWLLTFDGMPWRIAYSLGHGNDHVYQIAMSMNYVMNYAATASQAGIIDLPDDILPAAAILDETESGLSELREVVIEKWNEPGEKAYMRQRRLRNLVHSVKTSRGSKPPERHEADAIEDSDELL